MELYNQILSNVRYRDILAEIEEEELERTYCRHNLEHFLAVARIAYIENLEKNMGVSKDAIYAAALLHDIGRSKSFASVGDHKTASASVAEEILRECGCDDGFISYITSAIFNHGNLFISEEESLCGLLYRADKQSRNCYVCASANSCNWSDTKKNRNIIN